MTTQAELNQYVLRSWLERERSEKKRKGLGHWTQEQMLWNPVIAWEIGSPWDIGVESLGDEAMPSDANPTMGMGRAENLQIRDMSPGCIG
jgi:hypothetical protein